MPRILQTEQICEYHDGDYDQDIGLVTGGLWGWTIPCEADTCMWVNGVEVAWGRVSSNTPARILVQDDPNNDGDPGDSVTLTCILVLTQQEDTGWLVHYSVPPTQVSGTYFVTVTCNHEEGEYPAGFDTSSTQETSWATWGCPDPCEPFCGYQDYGLIDDFGLPGNWLITVHSEVLECPEDVNRNGVVDIMDIFHVLNHWGEGAGIFNVNCDDIVDIDDVFDILDAWGLCP
ncbi:MAG: hypothetical protein JSV91_02345 [Phycisphaerales bacterium]|nr:MAG: hypothetical protein JSV91_02345 [Phycisphaerales bacterium]